MTYYQESKQIIEKIDASHKILLVVHRSPDPDSVGSNLALYQILTGREKDVEIVSTDGLPKNLEFLPGFAKIQREDLNSKKLDGFDLLLAVDSASLGMLTKEVFRPPPSLFIVNIDHHYLNEKYGGINLVDDKIGSLGEVLYNLFSDWGVEVTSEVATCLMTGIAGDTGTFRFASGVSPDTFTVASGLLQKGASFPAIAFNLNQRISFATAKFWAKVLESMKIEKVGGYCFVWAAIPFSQLETLGGPVVNQNTSETFLANIEGTDFGMFLVEEEKGTVHGSLRSRTNVNVADIAKELGGGGHKVAAGFRVYGEFEEATRRIREKLEGYLKTI
ncbi:MAG: bifunctional oligoribonuclease/PAP phosphatase NrnA [Candidatus Blackburnbacteria bacterium]|nr:bifunctional oligoribonuclease/PAP phosphatase NrnA [Candidatus Blackburnbacteria bacterium]